MFHDIKLIDFKSEDKPLPDRVYGKSNLMFNIQLFGINENRETFSLTVDDFKPSFWIKIPNRWQRADKNQFVDYIKTLIGEYYENDIVKALLLKKKNLYMFDNRNYDKFLHIKFNNMRCFNKVKNLWYEESSEIVNRFDKTRGAWCLKKNGLKYKKWNLTLYESNIPPILRFFHKQNISPSGWIRIKESDIDKCFDRISTCKYEFIVPCKKIEALNDKDTIVPYKICSFDIEASSSHGDFPLAVKTYKKNAYNFMEVFDKSSGVCVGKLIERFVKTMFGYDDMENVENVYPKTFPSEEELDIIIQKILSKKVMEFDVDKDDDIGEDETEEVGEDVSGDEEESRKKTRAKKCDINNNIL